MSLLMVRKSAPAHAADASEVQRVEKLLKRELTDAEFWKLGDYVMKHMKVGKTFTDNELLSAVKDSAADSAEFKKGDKVVSRSSGAKGVVVEVYGNGQYAVLFEGAKNPDRIGVERIKAVDSNAEEIVNHDRIPVDQLGGEANARKHGYIIAKKGGRVYGVHIDGYSDKLAKETIEEAGYTVVGDSNADSAQDAYIAFPTPPANGKPFPQEARIIEKLKKEMMDFASHVEDAAHHFDFVANVNKRGNTLEEQELYDFYRAWEHKCDSIRAALH